MAERTPAPSRLLMTADAVGGVWTYAVGLATELAARGTEVTLATMGDAPSDVQRAQVAAIPGATLVESPFRLEWMDDPWDDVERAGAWLLALEDRVRPDVVHLNGYAHGALPFRAPALVVAHSCVLSWWRAVKREEAPARYAAYRDAVTRGLLGAEAVVAPTAAMRDALFAEYPRARSAIARARVIANASEPTRVHAAAKEPFVLTAGRLWDEAKNVAAVDRVAARLPWPVFVAGSTRCPSGEAAPGAASFGAARPLGVLAPDVLAGWMARASIYALPARYEPFGLSVLEAALAGCALVLGDVASLRETWGDAALYVDPEDTRALERTLAASIADPALRAALGDRARARAMRFTPRVMADAYLDLYAAIADAPRLAPPADALRFPAEELASCAS